MDRMPYPQERQQLESSGGLNTVKGLEEVIQFDGGAWGEGWGGLVDDLTLCGRCV